MYLRAKASLCALLVCVMALAATPASAAPKISVTPANATLAPAQSVSVTFALNEPIICAGSPPTCDVVLNFSASQRLGVTMTPNIVTWTQVESRNVIVTFDAPTPAIQSQTIILTATAVSNSEFYNGFAVSFPVNVVVPAPTPTPTPSDSLAQTGASVEAVPLGAGILGLGVAVVVGATYLRRRLQRN
jgi:hypothetical protein